MTAHAPRIRARVDARTARANEAGFTLVEMMTSLVVMVVVLAAAWLMLTATSNNLNMIGNGGMAAESNRAALAAFERDLTHGVLPGAGVSPVLEDTTMTCTILVSDTGDSSRQLVTWRADTQHDVLVRVLTRQLTETAEPPTSLADFADGPSTTTTEVTGLDLRNTSSPPLFSYSHDATSWDGSVQSVGLVTIHLRNGLPASTDNVADGLGVYRVTAYVINGY